MPAGSEEVVPDAGGAAAPSGAITEKTAPSCISKRSATANAKAPPLPPSPITIEMVGVGRSLMSAMDRAISRAKPRSSASMPG